MEILAPGIEEYVERMTSPHEPLLAELSEETRRSLGAAGMLTGPVAGREATLIVWSPDYDGKGKAWVRYDDGTDAIVGASRVERS